MIRLVEVAAGPSLVDEADGASDGNVVVEGANVDEADGDNVGHKWLVFSRVLEAILSGNW